MYETQRWGVEIEAYGLDRQAVAEIVYARTGEFCLLRDNNYPTSPLFWSVVHDGSIGREKEFELRTPALVGEQEAWRSLRAVCAGLREAGAKTGVTCGLHVHQDASVVLRALMCEGLSLASAEYAFGNALRALYAQLEPAIDSAMPASRRGNTNRYCRSLCGRGAMDEATHYDKASVSALYTHTTVEYRHHSGTLLATKIIPWVKLTGLIHAAAAERALGTRDALPVPLTSIEAVLDYLGASADLTEYWVRRRDAFVIPPCEQKPYCQCLSCAATRADITHFISRYLQPVLTLRSGNTYSLTADSVEELRSLERDTLRAGLLAISLGIEYGGPFQARMRRLRESMLLHFGVSVKLVPSLTIEPRDAEEDIPDTPHLRYEGDTIPGFVSRTEALRTRRLLCAE